MTDPSPRDFFTVVVGLVFGLVAVFLVALVGWIYAVMEGGVLIAVIVIRARRGGRV